MKSKSLLKAIGMFILLLFTTGILVPWIISNALMPIWMIVLALGAIIFLWVLLLEWPYQNLVKFALRVYRK